VQKVPTRTKCFLASGGKKLISGGSSLSQTKCRQFLLKIILSVANDMEELLFSVSERIALESKQGSQVVIKLITI
jgi:hypothetical protein